MTQKPAGIDLGVFDAVVLANIQIGLRLYRLELELPPASQSAFAKTVPGQFVQIDLSNTALPPAEAIPPVLLDTARRDILLRRPFSFSDVTVKSDKVITEILYYVVGPATLRMTTLSMGDSVSIIGPLGNGFRVPKNKKIALLIAGGTGVGPLQHLAKVLTAEFDAIQATAFVGAGSAKKLPFEIKKDEISQQPGFSLAEFAGHNIKSLVATDDGSAGYRGAVTDCFSQWLRKTGSAGEDVIIYGCGPEAMLAKVAEIAEAKDIDCQVSMERRMACGIGICQSCAVECKVNGSNKTVYKLCCKDGPVFDSREVVFSL